MTWRTQNGVRILQGAEAALIRVAVEYVSGMVEEGIDGHTKPRDFRVSLFDRLEPPAQLALLAEVGWALLRDTDSCPPLTAINEAVIGVLFCEIEQCVVEEIDAEDCLNEPLRFWRNRILAVYQETGDVDELPSADCTDQSEWSLLIEGLSDRILWDDDFNDADEYLDMPPEKGQYIKQFMGIADDYFRAVPPDPKESELPQIRATLADLYCQ